MTELGFDTVKGWNATNSSFAAVTKAVLRGHDDPRFTEEQDVIFVNKDRIEYLVAAESWELRIVWFSMQIIALLRSRRRIEKQPR